MVLIIKPVSAQLTKDKDNFGKSVHYLINSGPLLRDHDRIIEATNKSPQWRRQTTPMVRYPSVQQQRQHYESPGLR